MDQERETEKRYKLREILRDEDGEGEGRESLKDEVLGEMTESGAMAQNPSAPPPHQPLQENTGQNSTGGRAWRTGGEMPLPLSALLGSSSVSQRLGRGQHGHTGTLWIFGENYVVLVLRASGNCR